MAIIDDLTGLLAPDGPAPSEFRQGVVTAISLVGTGTNTISVGGQFLTNIPFVSPADAINYTVGTVVLLLRVGASWCILGRPGLGGSGSGGATGDSGGSAGSTFASGNYAPDIGGVSVVKVTGALAVPVWANTASCIAILRTNAQNNSAGAGYLHCTVDINGVNNHPGRNGAVGGTAGEAAAGFYAMTIGSNTVANFAVTPGGSVTINGWAWVTQQTGSPVTWGAAGSVSEMTVDVLVTYNRV